MITVERDTFTDNSTEGEMLIDGAFECFTLEPRRRQDLGKPFCTPAGVYLYVVQRSRHFQRDVICIENVPGFDAIEVHPGNFPKDTHGCTCVGSTRGVDFVGHSDAEFDALLAKIPRTGQIEYKNLYES